MKKYKKKNIINESFRFSFICGFFTINHKGICNYTVISFKINLKIKDMQS